MTDQKKQHRKQIIDKHWGGDERPLLSCKPKLDEKTFVDDVYQFWNEYPDLYQRLFHCRDEKVLGHPIGKGEILLYFIFDDALLGGPTSPIDLLKHDDQVGSVTFAEIKAAKRFSDGRMHSFRLGNEAAQASYVLTQGLHEILVRKGKKFADDLGIVRHTDVKRSVMKLLWKDSDFQVLERKFYDELLRDVLGTHPVVFFDTDTGMIITFRRLQRRHLQLERISGGQARLIVSPFF